jgi:hypothetical protein
MVIEAIARLSDDDEYDDPDDDAGNQLSLDNFVKCEVGAFYWTVLAPDIVNSGREEQGSVSV